MHHQLRRLLFPLSHRTKTFVLLIPTTRTDDDEGPQDDDAWLLEDLTALAGLYSRLRDREQLIELIFDVSRDVYVLY
jgi:hypothetical protein